MEATARRPTIQSMIKSYTQLQSIISKNRRMLLQNEFIHISFVFYVQILKEYLRKKFNLPANLTEEIRNKQETYYKNVLESLKKTKRDFDSMNLYKMELDYFFNAIQNIYSIDQLSNDQKIMKFLKMKDVVLSPFAYENFLVILNNPELKSLKEFVSNCFIRVHEQVPARGDIKLHVAQNVKKESYVGTQTYFKNCEMSKMEDINKSNYITGMSRDVYNFIHKLEEIFQKKQSQKVEENPHLDIRVYSKEELFDKKSKFPIEKSSDTFLSGCPSYKNKYLVDFAKNYINRQIINSENDPSIINISLEDTSYKVSVVEMNISMKVLLLGYMSGKIKIIILYEDIKYDFDPNAPEKNAKTTKLVTDSLPFNSDPNLTDFGTHCKSFNLKGHSAAVTSLSLAYDSFCFLSGSADSEIRLWNVRSGLCLAIFSMHISTVADVCFCPKSFFFASGGMDKQVSDLTRFTCGQPTKAHP
jgi:hypothetical protein